MTIPTLFKALSSLKRRSDSRVRYAPCRKTRCRPSKIDVPIIFYFRRKVNKNREVKREKKSAVSQGLSAI
jgi:hypothetical protein